MMPVAIELWSDDHRVFTEAFFKSGESYIVSILMWIEEDTFHLVTQFCYGWVTLELQVQP